MIVAGNKIDPLRGGFVVAGLLLAGVVCATGQVVDTSKTFLVVTGFVYLVVGAGEGALVTKVWGRGVCFCVFLIGAFVVEGICLHRGSFDCIEQFGRQRGFLGNLRQSILEAGRAHLESPGLTLHSSMQCGNLEPG